MLCRARAIARPLASSSIDKGHFAGAKLDGLNMAIAVKWPGAVHEGRGTLQPIIDERADEAQRQGMLSILTGKETDPMSTFWAVYAAMCETVLPPVHTRISIDLDMQARRRHAPPTTLLKAVANRSSTRSHGAEHRVGIVLPNGFEYGQNEVGRGWSTSTGGVAA